METCELRPSDEYSLIITPAERCGMSGRLNNPWKECTWHGVFTDPLSAMHASLGRLRLHKIEIHSVITGDGRPHLHTTPSLNTFRRVHKTVQIRPKKPQAHDVSTVTIVCLRLPEEQTDRNSRRIRLGNLLDDIQDHVVPGISADALYRKASQYFDSEISPRLVERGITTGPSTLGRNIGHWISDYVEGPNLIAGELRVLKPGDILCLELPIGSKSLDLSVNFEIEGVVTNTGFDDFTL